ncbi:MAG: HlyD family efflux transporter periplasmic adaptor subunit [Acidobacteria bacterium]|nr:HlyD family efflux transporter periplasmic adaptor subunit [Acidobacteriota bacterium]
MDIPIRSQVQRRPVRRVVYAIILVAAVAGISLILRNMEPAAPLVERASVWIDTVKRGPMIRQVRGLGTLVVMPEYIRWIPAVTSGRVERKLMQPGAKVHPDTILLILSNPQLEQETLNAEWDWKAAETSYQDLRIRMESQYLNQEADAARLESEYQQARMRLAANRELAKLGLVPELNLKLEEVTAELLASRIEIERKRLQKLRESNEAQLAVQQARVAQLRAVYDLRRSQIEQLKVRAGMHGVLQIIPVEVGQQVAPGTNLARVADPTKLKAELRIPETQAKDVQIGQSALIDTRNGTIPGRVIRIDPAVQNGTVTVDAELLGELPKGARPDLSVDGTIEIERLEDVVYVGRPVQGQPGARIGLFRLSPDGREAHRIVVLLGRSSVSTIEILEGLQPGDQVILSDMSAQDAFDRIRLK